MQGTLETLKFKARPALNSRNMMIKTTAIDQSRKNQYYALGFWGTKTIGDLWRERLEVSRNRTYVIDTNGGSKTYGEVESNASKLANWLKESNVRKGEVVAVQLPGWVEYAPIFIACLKIGAIILPIPITYLPAETADILNRAEAKALFCPLQFRNKDYYREYKSSNKPIFRQISICAIDKQTYPPLVPLIENTFTSILKSFSEETVISTGNSDDIACILPTSGTTGKPKLVAYTHNNVIFSEKSYVSVLPLTESDVMWMPSPINHATGFFHGLIANMLIGGSVLLQSHYNRTESLTLVSHYGCTWSHGSTTFIYDLLDSLDNEKDAKTKMRFYICGGSPMPESMVERAKQYSIKLCESYGSTESCPHVYVPLESVYEWNGNWSGIPYKGIEIKIVDEEGNEVPRGIPGEECSRGPNLFLGYFSDNKILRTSIDEDGWFHSGDIGIMDEQGRLKIIGRKKEIIIRGGENIAIPAIDNNLNGFPGIKDHATVPVPNSRLGETICTFMVPEHKGMAPTVKTVQDYMKRKDVPKSYWPERIEEIDAIPYTDTGKVNRALLTNEAIARSNMTESNRGQK